MFKISGLEREESQLSLAEFKKMKQTKVETVDTFDYSKTSKKRGRGVVYAHTVDRVIQKCYWRIYADQ